MAKWSGVYLEDCHKLLKNIEKEIEKAREEESRVVPESKKYAFAVELQDKIKKWRKDMYNEK
jgi:hypothetical protein